MSGLTVLVVFLCVGAAAAVLMLTIALYKSNEPLSQAAVTARGYAVRRYWFAAILAACVAAFIVTIPEFPYPRAQTQGRHVSIVAEQYAFVLPQSVPADTEIIFDVTSRDVNHGFGIYNPENRIVGQVQAMPGYVNHLPFRFTVRGRYTIRCLEYCGIAHSTMEGGFDVR